MFVHLFCEFLEHWLNSVFFPQEADKHAKELIEEEERRKEKTEKNKRKKLVSIGIIFRINHHFECWGCCFFPLTVIHNIFFLSVTA